MSSPLRGRFAPSPTGRLHLGNARSALLGWLQARAAGGTFLLRIEDLDPQRSRPEAVEALLADLAYLGLDWDEPPLFQSRRAAEYDAALALLGRAGRTYPCFCSRAEIALASSAPHGPQDDGPRYPGTCRGLSAHEAAARARVRPAALRFRPAPGVTSFVDAVHGPTSQDVEQAVGDFVVRRADGVASYQLAVVVDDAASGITDVLRGDDLLLSTPRQLQLYQALGLVAPRFAHVPLLLGEDGKRLAKRAGALAVSELRARGVDPRRVVALLARWSGLEAPDAVSARELAARFRLEAIARTATVVREDEVERALGLR